MASNGRLELQKMLEDLLGSKNVYYQTPASIKMNYPAIVYSKEAIDSRHANNVPYLHDTRYKVTVIDRNPDNPIIRELIGLPLSSYDRHYESDGLNHDVINLYW